LRRKEVQDMTLALVPIHDTKSSPPAALHELAAARYLGMSRPTFRSLLFSGAIPYTGHVGGRQRIFLRSDLDAYLSSLPRRRMDGSENPPSAPEGVE
jgi:excisionase family DNA binding protein